MAQIVAWPWAMVAAWFSGTALVCFCVVNFLRPWWRLKIMETPCDVYFVIHAKDHGVPAYAEQDDLGHLVKELVLPPNALVEVQIDCYPKLPIKINEMRFGCEGSNSDKPQAEKRVTRFVANGKSKWIPGIDDDYVGLSGGYHWSPRYAGRSAPSCMAVGFELRTKKPGRYKASVVFFMDELEGVADDLTIIVEDRPVTQMRCHHPGHWEWKCHITPKTL